MTEATASLISSAIAWRRPVADIADRLRRLTQEAVAVCLCGLPTCDSCRREGEASTTLRYALPALADVVEVVEYDMQGHRVDCSCDDHRALAALRAVLEVGK